MTGRPDVRPPTPPPRRRLLEAPLPRRATPLRERQTPAVLRDCRTARLAGGALALLVVLGALQTPLRRPITRLSVAAVPPAELLFLDRIRLSPPEPLPPEPETAPAEAQASTEPPATARPIAAEARVAHAVAAPDQRSEAGVAWRPAPEGWAKKLAPAALARPRRGRGASAPKPWFLVDTPDEVFYGAHRMPIIIGGLQDVRDRLSYPPRCERMGIQGRVIIQFVVNEFGRPVDSFVMEGIGGGCDEAALEAVDDTRFLPAIHDGRPVRVRIALPIRFVLR